MKNNNSRFLNFRVFNIFYALLIKNRIMFIQNVGFDEINYLKIALRMDILAWPKGNLTVKESISTPFGMAPPGSVFLSV